VLPAVFLFLFLVGMGGGGDGDSGDGGDDTCQMNVIYYCSIIA